MLKAGIYDSNGFLEKKKLSRVKTPGYKLNIAILKKASKSKSKAVRKLIQI
jgi:hypothetical protein